MKGAKTVRIRFAAERNEGPAGLSAGARNDHPMSCLAKPMTGSTVVEKGKADRPFPDS